MKTLYDMTHAERVAWFRANPPNWGSNGNHYRNGMKGLPCLTAQRGSFNYAAYCAGKANREQK